MIRLLVALFTLLLPATVMAAPALDAFSVGDSGTGNLSWTHTPVGTPRGVIVWCGYISTAHQIDSITYGGDAMTEVELSPLVKLNNESASVHAYFLGTSIPTGAQTVSVTVNDITFKRCSSWTVTAGDDTSVNTVDTLTSDSLDDPSSTLVTSDGVETFVTTALMTGFDAVGSVSPIAGYTVTLNSDQGTMVFNLARKSTNPTGGNVTYGWTSTSAEDVIMMGVAIREGTGGGQAPRSMHQFRLRRF